MRRDVKASTCRGQAWKAEDDAHLAQQSRRRTLGKSFGVTNTSKPDSKPGEATRREAPGVCVARPRRPSTRKCGAGFKEWTTAARRSVSAPARARGHASSISERGQTQAAKCGEVEEPCGLNAQRSRLDQEREPGRKSFAMSCEEGRGAGATVCRPIRSGGGRLAACRRDACRQRRMGRTERSAQQERRNARRSLKGKFGGARRGTNHITEAGWAQTAPRSG